MSKRKTWNDHYDFACAVLGYSHDEATAYAHGQMSDQEPPQDQLRIGDAPRQITAGGPDDDWGGF